MFELKPIAKDAVQRALAKAERYRLLNEPREAESICRDVLAIDARNQEALICLILALTDLFDSAQVNIDEVRPQIAQLTGEYERRYYEGVVEERWAKALLDGGYPRELIYTLIRSAMHHFAAADPLAPPGNDDAVLRWNSCVRIIERHALAPADESAAHVESFDDDVPMR